MHVVTGGAGFVGSHLVDALLDQGDYVKVVDNFSRGSFGNLTKAVNTNRFHFDKTDLATNRIPIGALDTVWHFAAKVAGIDYNRYNHYDMLQSNLAINLNVIESVRRKKPKLFVYVSTACVYPHDAPVPTPEFAGIVCDPEPTNHGYGVAKWAGEQLVRHLTREHNVPCVIVRFFNVIGPRDYYDETSHVVPALIRRISETENRGEIEVWGTGLQTRSFVDVRDIATALIKLSAVEEAHDGEPVNVGGREEISIGDLVNLVALECKKEIKVNFDTSKPDGHARRAPDVTRLQNLIGWVPDMPLQQSVRDMVAEFNGR